MKLVSVFIAFWLPLMAKSSNLAARLEQELNNPTRQFNDYDFDVLAARPPGYIPNACPFGPDVISIGDIGRHRNEVAVTGSGSAAAVTEEKKEKKKSSKSKKEKKEKKEKKRRHSKKMSSSSSSSRSSSSDSEASEKRARKAMKKELKKKGTAGHPSTEGADISQCPHYKRFLAEKSVRK